MLDFRKGFRKRLKCAVSIIIISAVIVEWLFYILIPWFQWPQLPKLQAESIKILVVGDPQLLGEHFTSDNIFGYLARWDSDRFIAKTFSFAYNYVNPDIIIFLGDNLDEGEIASDEEYIRYLKRFKKVFEAVDFNKAIVLPGDNDIGGENEPPSIEKQNRFDKYFKNDIFMNYRFVEFIKVNYMTQANSYLSIPNTSDGVFRILLSHIPLTPIYSSFTRKVLSHVQPHLILSAHEHTSVHLVSQRISGTRTHTETSFCEFGTYTINLTALETHEIMVPTCSYRMGTDKMGYGVIFLDTDGQFTYSVLWLPSRFQQLFLYLGLSILALLLLVPFPFWAFLDRILCHKEATLQLSHGKKI